MTNLFCPRCIPRAIWALCAACFLACLWIGSTLYRKPPAAVPVVVPPQNPPAKVTLIFKVYDTQGRPLDTAMLVGPAPDVTQPVRQGDGCQLSLNRGQQRTLEFRYGSQTEEVPVSWRSGDDYLHWLDDDLPRQLRQLDPHHDDARWQTIINAVKRRTTPTKYDYPVAFRVKH